MEPDPTVINRVIHYSILLRNIRLTLLELRKTMILIRGLSFTVPSYKDLKQVEEQLQNRAEEVQRACKSLLLPLFEGIDFGHDYLNHWAFSMNDIKYGYCELEEILNYGSDNKPKMFGRKYILLLRDYKDQNLGIFKAGTLINWVTASHFLNDIPEQPSKVKGLYDAIVSSMLMATNYRISKNLFKNE